MNKLTKGYISIAALALMLVPANAAMASAITPRTTASGVTLVTAEASPKGDMSVQNYNSYTMLNRRLVSNSYVNTGQTLATCQAAGGTCTISRALSATRTIGVTLGASRTWASGQLNISAAEQQTVTAACTSPTLSSGQTWRAYPHGQRYSYQIRSQYYGNDGGVDFPIGSPTTSGTLYAFNPTGVSCRVG